MPQFSELLHREFVFTLDDVVWFAAAVLASVIFLVLMERLVRSVQVADIRRKYVLITGCDTGFGKIAALRLDKLGCHVLAGCLTEDGARALREEGTERLMTVQLDVTDADSICKARDFVSKTLPAGTGLWGLVNNAGILGVFGPMNWFQRHDLQASFNVNVFGMHDVTREFLPLIKKARGRIVNTASAVGFCVLPFIGPYCMTKHAVEAFSDAYRYEMSPFGVSVHVVEPGIHRTPFLDKERLKAAGRRLWEKQPAAVKEEYGEKFFEHTIWQALELSPLLASTDLNNVPRAYEHALFSALPRKRYRVGLDSVIVAVLACLPSICTDWVYRLPRLRNIPAACKK